MSIIASSYAKNGYAPKRGDWYEPMEEPRPAVYHKFAKQDVIGELYPDLVEPLVKSASDISKAVKESVDDVIEVKLGADIYVAPRTDGKISTIMVGPGKTLKVDLNGHEYRCQAYAFYSTGGTIVIKDSKGTGSIVSEMVDTTYSIIQNNGGRVIIEAGTIKSGAVVEEGHFDWMYGVVNASGGIIEVNGGTISTVAAAALSINNGDGRGDFYIRGNAVVKSSAAPAIYQTSMDIVEISGNAKVLGGILARMGTYNIKDNAQVINNLEVPDDFGENATFSGCFSSNYGLLAMTGCYKYNGTGDLGNDLTVNVSGNALIKSNNGEAFAVGMLDNNYDQKAVCDIASDKNLLGTDDGIHSVKVMSYDDIKAIVEAAGKTMPAKKATTDLTIKIAGEVIYPVPEPVFEGGGEGGQGFEPGPDIPL